MIPLGVHSHFSMLHSPASPQALCRQAKKLGYTALGLTDINNLYGLWTFLAACDEEDITPIIGAEIRQADQRLFCLVKNSQGYRNLCRLLSHRHCCSPFCLAEALTINHAGLILMVSEISLLRHCKEIGADAVAALTERPNEHNNRLRQAARRLSIPSVAVSDVFFIDQNDYHVHSLLRAIAGNTSLSRLAETESISAENLFVHPDEYMHRFHQWPEVVKNTAVIAEKCTFRSPAAGLILPPYHQDDADGLLRKDAYAGARQRYRTPLPVAVTQRLEHELQVIASMQFSSYFLVVRDIVAPVSRTCGRGSGAASLVAYCLNITNVCPIKHNLYFERFLNPGRSDAPDIDVDFAWDERDQVLTSLFNHFGNRAAMVCNHVTLQPRMAIRETAKVFGLPGGEISRITKKMPWIWRHSGENSPDYLTAARELPQLRGADLSGPWPDILRLAERISGIPRNLSVHPGGVVITPKPVTDYVPVERAPKGVPIIQWDKDGAEEAGLVKIDLLGNRSLGVIRDAITLVRENEDKDKNAKKFSERDWEPEDDAATRKTIAAGKTMGCFYIESPAMRLLQKKAGVGDFGHLVIHSSIIRPAANEFIREYLRRLHGGTWQPLHQLLSGVLDDTYGIMVYQEDVSRVAVQFGFSHTDADRLRKIMSKKDKEKKLGDFKAQFFSKARERQVSEVITKHIWDMMISFDGYSFCKPHSASYARVSFQAAYLKTHFPAEFMAAVISNQGGFYSTFAYVSEARRMGLTILPPDVNQSTYHWHGHHSLLRVGLMAVRSLSRKTGEKIVQLRQQHVFVSMVDFLRRVQPAHDEAGALIHCGALDNLESYPTGQPQNRGALFWLLARWGKNGKTTAKSIFTEAPALPLLPPENRVQRLRNEYRVLGFLCACHPITLFAGQRQQSGAVTAREIRRHSTDNQKTTLCFLGWLITGKVIGTKKGELMQFLSFEDETGQVECTFFPRIYNRYCHLLQAKGPLLLEGYVDEEYGVCTLTVERVANQQANFSFTDNRAPVQTGITCRRTPNRIKRQRWQ